MQNSAAFFWAHIKFGPLFIPVLVMRPNIGPIANNGISCGLRNFILRKPMYQHCSYCSISLVALMTEGPNSPYRQFDELHKHEIRHVPGGAPHTVQARVENITL